MIEAASGIVACPHCGGLHEDPRYVSSMIWRKSYSDLYMETVSMMGAELVYVQCHHCRTVDLIANYSDERGDVAGRFPKIENATLDVLYDALNGSVTPFDDPFAREQLSKHIWRVESRKLACGVRCSNSERRLALISSLETLFAIGSSIPLKLYLWAELLRQKGDFDLALLKLRMLQTLEGVDPLLARYGLFNEQLCVEKCTQQREIKFPRTDSKAMAIERAPLKFSLLMHDGASELITMVRGWTSFPYVITSFTDIRKNLPAIASVCSPQGGVILRESDLAQSFTNDAGHEDFIRSIAKVSRVPPWLLIGEKCSTSTRVEALRNAGFHATSIAYGALTQHRILEWTVFGQRRALQHWRRIEKSK